MGSDHQKKTTSFFASALPISLFPLLLGVLCYLGALSHGFVLDDLIHITGNPLIRSSASVLNLFVAPTYPGNLYRPLVTLSYLLTYQLWELAPLPYHATNIVLHGLICWLLHRVLMRVMPGRAALWIAILFAVHPLHVEAVAGVSGRAELLAHLCGMSALYVVVVAPRYSMLRTFPSLLRGCAVFAGLLGAMLSKESGVSYLLLIPLSLWFTHRSTSSGWLQQVRTYSVELLAAGLATGCYLLLRWIALGALVVPISPSAFVDNPLLQAEPIDRMLNGFILLGKYLYLSMTPAPLGIEYSHVSPALFSSLMDIEAVGYLVLFFVFVLVAFKGIKRRERHGFFALWFFAGFAVTSNILFPIGAIFAERLAYISLAGAMGTLVLYLEQLHYRAFRIAVFSGLVGIYCFQTFLYTSVWRNSETLFTWQVRHSPTSVKALVNYSIALRNSGNPEKALAYASKAKELYPDYAEASFALATIRYAQGADMEGRKHLLETIALNPVHTPALNMLGRVLFNEKDYPEAKRYFSRGLRSSPDNVESQIGLFAVALSTGSLEEAVSIRHRIAPFAGDGVEFKQLDAALKRLLKGRQRHRRDVV